MEIIIKIIGIALISSFAIMLIKPIRPDFAVLIGVVGGLVILGFVISQLSYTVNFFETVIEKTGVSKGIFSLVLKVVAIGYLTEFGASLCNDCGNSSLGDKLLFSGKIVLLVMALPIVTQILEVVMELLP